MSDPPVIEDAVAIVPVRDLAETIAFYRDVLGFEPQLVTEDGSFGTVVRGSAAIHFTTTRDAEALRATAMNLSLHVWVRNLDRLYDELRPKLESLPEDWVRPPFDQPYGVREFHVKDPDGCLLLFAESD